jgi:hypothetical protein
VPPPVTTATFRSASATSHLPAPTVARLPEPQPAAITL